MESIGFVKIFDLRFLMDLHVFCCLKHNFTIYTKCLSVCVSARDTNIVTALDQKRIDGTASKIKVREKKEINEPINVNLNF